MTFIENVKARAKTLKIEALTLGLAAGHRRTPWYAKVLVAGFVAYIVTPVDLIPDFIPVLGLVDDILFIPVAIWLARKLVPDDVLAECRTRAVEVADGARMRRLGRLIVFSLWSVAVLTLGLMVYYSL
jgi:uncharacterized membrane protein YkvA (DUF1232 family)